MRMSAIWWFIYGQAMVLTFFVTWCTGMLAKTHAKAAQTKVRVDSLIGVAKTVNTMSTTVTALTPIATGGNASFLAALNAIGGVTTNGSNPTPSSGSASFSTFAGAESYCDALADNLNDLLAYVNESAANFNGLVSSMASSNFT